MKSLLCLIIFLFSFIISIKIPLTPQLTVMIQCPHNHFLYNNSMCVESCPNGYINDILSHKCVQFFIRRNTTDYSYIKVNSLGSCDNLCGVVSTDCSCKQSCIDNKNCCKDFKKCEDLFEKNQLRQGECSFISNCELCDSFNGIVCGKCKEGFFMKDNQCVSKCDTNDRVILPNKICMKQCKIENCLQCDEDICTECIDGFFIDKTRNVCVKECPIGTKGDNLKKECKDDKAQSIFWIIGSKGSCQNKCGRDIDIGKGIDCSCDEKCYRKGNCCKDIENSCRFH